MSEAAGPTPAPEVPAFERSHNAQLGTKIYFWFNPRTEHIYQGAPPQFDGMKPPGYITIECNHALEAERWSARLNAQDKRVAEASDYEREQMEAPMREDLRREIRAQLGKIADGDSRNKRLNAAFLRQALKMLDHQEAKGKTIRESYLHVEGFEHGH